mmetsp:Transcript_16754/g.37788  ORF Transcript_16754/g.37788 Transcript_16754/m.37788 type:complete len:215 (-) Transcript_16754:108-752(-)
MGQSAPGPYLAGLEPLRLDDQGPPSSSASEALPAPPKSPHRARRETEGEGRRLGKDPNAELVVESDEEFGLSEWQLRSAASKAPEYYAFTPMPSMEWKDSAFGLSEVQLKRVAAAHAGSSGQPAEYFACSPRAAQAGGVAPSPFFDASELQRKHAEFIRRSYSSPCHLSGVGDRNRCVNDAHDYGDKPCRVCQYTGLYELCAKVEEDAALERPG